MHHDKPAHCPPSNGLRVWSILILLVELGKIAFFSYVNKSLYVDQPIKINIMAILVSWICANDTRKIGSIFGVIMFLCITGYEIALSVSALMWGHIGQYSSPLLVAVPLALLALVHFIQFILLIRRVIVQRRYPAAPSTSNDSLEYLLMVLISLAPIVSISNIGIFSILGLVIAWYSARRNDRIGLIVASLALMMTLWTDYKSLLLAFVEGKARPEFKWLIAAIVVHMGATLTAAIMLVRRPGKNSATTEIKRD